jgi:beta-glucosidase
MNDWGLRGIVCTDGGAFGQLMATHAYYSSPDSAAAGCIKAGITVFLDNYMAAIKGALSKNLVTEKEIDEAIYGNLRIIMKLGLLDPPGNDPYAGIGVTDTIAPWTKPGARELALEATRKSVVLMQNSGSLLPLNKGSVKSVAVIGPSANKVISDWYSGTPPYSVSIFKGIRNFVGDDVLIRFAMSNKADSAVIAARECDVAIVCVGNHPLSYGLGWGQNQVPSDGRDEVDRQGISVEQEDLVKLVYKANRERSL